MVKRKHRIRTDTLREIRGTFGRFLSITLLCMLATSFFSGLRTTAPDMRHTADVYFDETRLGDVRVLSTLGVTDGDVDALRALDGVEAAEGNWSLDALASSPYADAIVKLHALGSDINLVHLVEGRLPENDGECVTEQALLGSLGLEIGDTLMLDPSDEDSLAHREYTIVGVVNSSSYLSIERGSAAIGTGQVKAFVYLPKNAFTLDYYTEAHLTLDGALELQAYTDKYDELVDGFIDRNEEFADERAALRAQEIRDEAEAEYADAKAEADEELSAAKSELDDARKKLDDGYAELDDAKRELEDKTADARREIEDNRKKLDDGEAELLRRRADYDAAAEELDMRESQYRVGLQQLTDGRAQYDEKFAEYEAQLAQYEDGAAQLEQAKAQLAALEVSGADDPVTLATIAAIRSQIAEKEPELVAAKAQLDAAKLAFDENKQQLDATEAQLAAADAELANGRTQLEDFLAQLTSGEREIRDGRAKLVDAEVELESQTAEAEAEIAKHETELADGENEYADGLAEYLDAKAEAEEKLADARREIDDLDDCKWYVLSRDANIGYAAFSQDADRVSNLANVFPIIFFVVAALVCLTTMTRMVEEQRTQIGSLGSLGYTPLAISSKYIGYGLFSSLIGSMLGVALGETIIPMIIFTAWQILYSIPGDLIIPMDWGITTASVAAAVACTVGASLWASLSTLTSTPANLLRPRAPKPGKRVLIERIKPLWNRLNFIGKVTGRNLFRYKKRFFMTVIGIAGCTALMVTGFGLHDSIYDILEIQFDDIFIYQNAIGLEDGLTDDELAEIDAQLGELDILEDRLMARELTVDVSSDVRTESVYLFCLDPSRVDSFITLRHRSDHSPSTLTDDGVLITEKLSELLDLEVGDYITLEDGERAEARISDIVENYAMHYVYISPAYYEELFGHAPELTTVLARYSADAEAEDELSRALLEIDGVTGATRVSSLRDNFNDRLSSVNYAVVVIITAAAALAFVVLYNLTNINITERVRELATLKVLGFFDGEVSAYVYRENIMLTIFGLALGLLGGFFLHHWMVMTVEIDMVMFGRVPHTMNYVWAGILTVVFSVFVNLAAHFKIKRINMVESLKSIE